MIHLMTCQQLDGGTDLVSESLPMSQQISGAGSFRRQCLTGFASYSWQPSMLLGGFPSWLSAILMDDDAARQQGSNAKTNNSPSQVKLGIPGGEAMAAAAAEMLIPLKRIGTPDEAAGAMLMLASPYASFISGQVDYYMHLNSLFRTGLQCSVCLCRAQIAG